MTRYIKVTPQQVRAARFEVQAYETAGIEPDPYVVRVANAQHLSERDVRRLQSLSSSAAPSRGAAVDEGLREMIVPLETARIGASDTESGYRIARADYESPEITLTGDEAAAVGLALRLWESAQLSGAAYSALVKLKAAREEIAAVPGLPPQLRLESEEPAFEPCYAAARDRRRLKFDYRRPDEETPTHWHVEPWGVVAWHGRWYLVGFDLDRKERRSFQLSRVVGAPRPVGPPGAFEPPKDVDLAAMVADQFEGHEQLVVVLARPGTAIRLRLQALPLGPAKDGRHAGWDRLELRTTEPMQLADQLAAYGPDVVVEAPSELRDAVVERLTRLAAMSSQGAA